MKRIEAIASLVTRDAKVIDIGTDHAYLPIYLYKEGITKNITASDISKKVLEYTRINLEKHGLKNQIKVVLSDGFKDLSEYYDEAIIAGMGTHTIMDILSNGNISKSLIICSHNELDKLRLFMFNLGYKLEKEIVIKENNIYYDIMKYSVGSDNLSKIDIILGRSKSKEYRDYLINKYKNIYEKSKKEKHREIIRLLEECDI